MDGSFERSISRADLRGEWRRALFPHGCASRRHQSSQECFSTSTPSTSPALYLPVPMFERGGTAGASGRRRRTAVDTTQRMSALNVWAFSTVLGWRISRGFSWRGSDTLAGISRAVRKFRPLSLSEPLAVTEPCSQSTQRLRAHFSRHRAGVCVQHCGQARNWTFARRLRSRRIYGRGRGANHRTAVVSSGGPRHQMH